MRTAGSSFIAGRSGRSALLAVLAALGAAAGTGVASAQMTGSEPRRATPFTFGDPQDGFSIVEPPAGVPERRDESPDEGSGRWFFQRWEQAPQTDNADSLHKQAMQALDAGRVEEAQRLFERLIATSPRSGRAAEARQHLGRLYSRVETGATGASEGPRATSPSGIAPPPSVALVQRARVSASLDGQFLADAGDRVFFSVGSAALGTRARGVIQAQARFLKQHPHLSVAIEGHADDGGLPDVDLVALSEQRAAVVRDRLIAEGVDSGRILAYGRGRELRVSDCPMPECAAQNRRVVTILLSGKITDSKAGRRADSDRQPGPPLPTQ